MKKLAMILVSIFFMTPCILSAAEPQEALIAKAKAEGKVTFYVNITAIEPVMEAFTKKYGVKGEYTRVSTDKYVATVTTEHEAGKLMADVLQAPIPVLDILKAKGVLASYKSLAAADYPKWGDPRGGPQGDVVEICHLFFPFTNLTHPHLSIVPESFIKNVSVYRVACP